MHDLYIGRACGPILQCWVLRVGYALVMYPCNLCRVVCTNQCNDQSPGKFESDRSGAGVDLVVQTEPPKEPETYIHRSGRTGRAGSKGVCITLCSRKHEPKATYIEKV